MNDFPVKNDAFRLKNAGFLLKVAAEEGGLNDFVLNTYLLRGAFIGTELHNFHLIVGLNFLYIFPRSRYISLHDTFSAGQICGGRPKI